MGESNSEAQILSLLKSDARGLYNRITDRIGDYIMVFSLKRTRDHFATIFNNKYQSATMSDLKLCSVEVIEALDLFYSTVDNTRWYLDYTEDMPNTVEDKMNHFVKELTSHYEQLINAINKQLGIDAEKFVVPVAEPVESEEVATEEVSFDSAPPSFDIEINEDILTEIGGEGEKQ